MFTSRFGDVVRRRPFVLLALVFCSATAAAPLFPARAQGITTEEATDRPGSDYKHLIGVATPEDCRQACLSEVPCAAYTWVRPGVQGPQPACWLKDAVPRARSSRCCVSGRK